MTDGFVYICCMANAYFLAPINSFGGPDSKDGPVPSSGADSATALHHPAAAPWPHGSSRGARNAVGARAAA
jgi:hypothetical protein